MANILIINKEREGLRFDESFNNNFPMAALTMFECSGVHLPVPIAGVGDEDLTFVFPKIDNFILSDFSVEPAIGKKPEVSNVSVVETEKDYRITARVVKSQSGNGYVSLRFKHNIGSKDTAHDYVCVGDGGECNGTRVVFAVSFVMLNSKSEVLYRGSNIIPLPYCRTYKGIGGGGGNDDDRDSFSYVYGSMLGWW